MKKGTLIVLYCCSMLLILSALVLSQGSQNKATYPILFFLMIFGTWGFYALLKKYKE